MKKYRVVKVLTMISGVVGLDDNQVSRRLLCLKKTRGQGCYRIISPTQFKVGEIIKIKNVEKWHLNFVKAIK